MKFFPLPNNITSSAWLTAAFRSLYWKISIVFLILLIALGVAQGARMRYVADRSNQMLNWSLAQRLVEFFQPSLVENFDDLTIIDLLFEISSLYEGFDFYILDNLGKVVASLRTPESLLRSTINLSPIHEFLANSDLRSLPLYGEDPTDNSRIVVFSAAPLRLANKDGFLYVILDPHHQSAMRTEIIRGFSSGSAFAEIALLLFLTAGLGLILFFILTRRFHSMTSVVTRFQHGEFSSRIAAPSADEVGDLGRAFNTMAEKIETHIEELKEKDKQRRQLVANIVHDLRTPLTTIIGVLETIQIDSSQLTEERRARFIENSLISAHSLDRLIGDLFELSKLEAREAVPDPLFFSIVELADEICNKLSYLAEKKGVSLKVAVNAEVPEVYADRSLFERVLFNLLSNAVRHTPEGGEVSLTFDENEEQVIVQVKDTGCGIPASDLPHIFNRFYQSTGHLAAQRGGSGLGLAIVQRIIELHNTTIAVESEVNVGTKFTFSLYKKPIEPVQI